MTIATSPLARILMVAGLLGGCGGERHATKQPSAEVKPPAQTASAPAAQKTGASQEAQQDEETDEKIRKVEDLMLDVAIHEACEDARSEFHGLASSSSKDVIEGRLLIHRCDARRDKETMQIDASGRGWRWIGKKTEKLEGTFTVDQYVRFAAEVAAAGKLDWDYVENAHLLYMWFLPSKPAKVSIVPTSKVDAQPKSSWAALLGAATDIFGKSPDEKATQQVREKGSREVKKKIEEGYSFVLDLCTGQRYHEIGHVAQGDLPSKPVPARARIWLGNERVRVHPEGLDLAGPFEAPGGKIDVELSAEAGSPVSAKLVCDQDAHKIAEAFLQGKKPPDVDVLAEANVKKGAAGRLEADTTRCPAVLLTTAPKGKGPATFRYVARAVNANLNPLADCSRDSQERAPSEDSPSAR